MTRSPAATLGFLFLAALPVRAAVVTITDCVSDPHIVAHLGTASTRIELGNDDLVLACALAPLPGTERVIIVARDVTVLGPAGSISATRSVKAVDITATGRFTARDTSIESTGSNSSMEITAGGDMLFESSSIVLGGSSGGDTMRITCTGSAPDCTITAFDTTFESRLIRMTAVGDIAFALTRVVTHSPRDHVRLISTRGNVDVSGAGVSGTTGGGGENDCLRACGGGNTFVTGNEGNLLIEAYGSISVASANILVAEFITFTSGVGAGRASVPATIDVTGASVRNDFAKPGEIRMTADERQATINIEGAIIVDDDTSAANDVAELNGCEVVPRTLPPCVNIIGTPDVDS